MTDDGHFRMLLPTGNLTALAEQMEEVRRRIERAMAIPPELMELMAVPEGNPLTDMLRPWRNTIMASAEGGDDLAIQVIDTYRLSLSERDPRYGQLCRQSFSAWLNRYIQNLLKE